MDQTWRDGKLTAAVIRASRAGTASYLAPERFTGEPVCERTEIFAIGVTLYQALSGRLPHEAEPARWLDRIDETLRWRSALSQASREFAAGFTSASSAEVLLASVQEASSVDLALRH